jgi:hypothetical protein
MNTLWVGTRKGLFVAKRDGQDWHLGKPHFAGEAVTQFTRDTTGAWYAALRLGHFGVKVRKSTDEGATWQEVAAPAFPPKPVDGPWKDDTTPWSVDLIWGFEGGLPAGWPVHLRRRRRQLATCRKPVGAARAQGMVRRRLRPRRHPLDPRRSAR